MIYRVKPTTRVLCFAPQARTLTWLTKALLPLVAALSLFGCSSSMQWWRVGTCVVIYDTRNDARQVMVAGQHCDIRREELATLSGNSR